LGVLGQQINAWCIEAGGKKRVFIADERRRKHKAKAS
jgi:hypothetical protein